MSTFLTQKGNLGLKKLTRDQIVEILPPPITNETLASDLVQARRALDEVGELLRQKQLEYKERMRICDDREATLTQRQEQTRESVTKFAKFMKENDAKRARALKRAADEAKLRAEKDIEVEQVMRDLEATQLKFQKMQVGHAAAAARALVCVCECVCVCARSRARVCVCVCVCVSTRARDAMHFRVH